MLMCVTDTTNTIGVHQMIILPSLYPDKQVLIRLVDDQSYLTNAIATQPGKRINDQYCHVCRFCVWSHYILLRTTWNDDHYESGSLGLRSSKQTYVVQRPASCGTNQCSLTQNSAVRSLQTICISLCQKHIQSPLKVTIKTMCSILCVHRIIINGNQSGLPCCWQVCISEQLVQRMVCCLLGARLLHHQFSWTCLTYLRWYNIMN